MIFVPRVFSTLPQDFPQGINLHCYVEKPAGRHVICDAAMGIIPLKYWSSRAAGDLIMDGMAEFVFNYPWAPHRYDQGLFAQGENSSREIT